MSHSVPNPGDARFDPADPHGFHHDREGHDVGHQHHVSSWQLMVGVLVALLFFTFLTVAVAQGEAFIMQYTGIEITQLWNVIIAMSIATIKALFVCMYFMHLRFDNPLNTFVLLFTLLVFGLFLMFPTIDVATRAVSNPIKDDVLTPGGTGAMMSRPDGTDITGPIALQSRQQKIEAKAREYAGEAGREEPSDEDMQKARRYVWFHFYDAKAEHAHGKPINPAPDDEGAEWLEKWRKARDRELGIPDGPGPRRGLTPGLFDADPNPESDQGNQDEGHH